MAWNVQLYTVIAIITSSLIKGIECFKLYHWFGRFKSRQRSDGAVWMVEGVSNVGIMDTTHAHHHIAHLTTVSINYTILL